MKNIARLLVALIALNGCTESSFDEEASDFVVAETGVFDGFVTESLGIGPRWYDYSPITHVLTPKDQSYILRWDEWARRVRLESYYNLEGDSGYFSLSVSVWDAGWSAPSRLEIATNVKDAPVCVALDDLQVVDCSETHHLVLRTDRRAVPAAGFSVDEPGLYFATHRSFGDSEAWIVQGAAAEFDPFAETADGATSVLSVLAEPGEGVLGGLPTEVATREFVHATADFRLCWWRLDDHSTSAEDVVLRVNSRCGELASTATEQAALDSFELVETEVIAPLAADYSVAFVALDSQSGAIVRVVESIPPAGAWPENTEFDFFIEREGDEIVFGAGPGALIHAVRSELQSELPAIPGVLWAM